MHNTINITNSGGDDKPALTLNSGWVGSGEFITDDAIQYGSGVQFYGAGRHVWNKADIASAHKTKINKRVANVTIYPQENFAGTPVTAECILDVFNLNLDNGVTPNYNCARSQDGDGNKGAIAGSADASAQTVGFDITAIADSTFVQGLNLIERMKTGEPFSVTIGFEGGEIGATGTNHLALFKIAKTSVSEISWDRVLGKQGVRIASSPLASGSTPALTLELTTNVQNFATYIAA
jgi:hypothetical protein